MPFEKEIYMNLLMNYLKEEQNRMEKERAQNNASG
jgi:hypothetical protein